MTTMLEKMARAAEAAAEYDGDDGMADSQGIARVANWPAVARAALLAIREPDQDVRESGITARRYDPHNINPHPVWSAMIDAILGDDKP